MDHIVSAIPQTSRDYAMAKRAEKRAWAEEIGVEAGFIDGLVDAFYAKVAADRLLGPIFQRHVTDWPPHLARMKAFWRSILHNSGEFSGNPMLKHIAIPGLEFGHFERWLHLFYQTLRESGAPAAAATLVGGRARMIAHSLLTAIETRRDAPSEGRTGKDLPHV